MRFQYIFAILIALFPQMSVFGQKVVVDSLADKSYSELKSLFYEYFSEDKIFVEKIARYTLNKAIKENAYEAIANSYIRLHRVHINDITLAIKYTDSSLKVCNTNSLHKLRAENYNNLGNLNYRSYKYESALDYYLKARKYYKKVRNESYYTVQHNIANLKLKGGSHGDALTIFKECLA